MNIKIKMPKFVERQKYWFNLSSRNPVDYFKLFVFISFVDFIMRKLNDCFNNHKEVISGFQVLINPCVKGDFCHRLNYYQEDVAGYEKVIFEISLCHRYLNNIKPRNALDALLEFNLDFFLSIYT